MPPALRIDLPSPALNSTVLGDPSIGEITIIQLQLAIDVDRKRFAFFRIQSNGNVHHGSFDETALSQDEFDQVAPPEAVALAKVRVLLHLGPAAWAMGAQREEVIAIAPRKHPRQRLQADPSVPLRWKQYCFDSMKLGFKFLFLFVTIATLILLWVESFP